MDITTFRWILIIVGVIIIAGIFLLGQPDRKRKPRASRKRIHAARVRREPGLVSDHQDEHKGETGSADGLQTELPIGESGVSGERIEPQLGGDGDHPSSVSTAPLPDKIITLFLEARDNHVISGVELLDASLKSGLVFGSHDIFSSYRRGWR